MQEKTTKKLFFVHFFTFTSQFNMSMYVSVVVLSAPQLHFFCTICLVRTIYLLYSFIYLCLALAVREA